MSFVVCTKCICCIDAEVRSKEMYPWLALCKALYILDFTINNQNQVY